MNIFNRIVVIILVLKVAIFAIVLAVVPDQFVTTVRQYFDPLEITWLDRIILAVAAAVITLVGLVLIRLELKRQQRRGVILANVEGALANLSTDSMAVRLKSVLESLPDVYGANPSVMSRGKSVDVSVTLVADPRVDATQKATEAVAAIREAVEQGMGVPLTKRGPRVNLKYRHGSSLRPDAKG